MAAGTTAAAVATAAAEEEAAAATSARGERRGPWPETGAPGVLGTWGSGESQAAAGQGGMPGGAGAGPWPDGEERREAGWARGGSCTQTRPRAPPGGRGEHRRRRSAGLEPGGAQVNEQRWEVRGGTRSFRL